MSAETDRIAGISGHLAVKAPVVAATTVNITLSGEQIIDGVAVVADERVLVKDQTDGSENGIYDVSTTAWSRSKDFNGARDVVSGTSVWDNNNMFFYAISTPDPITIDTTSITFIASGATAGSLPYTPAGTGATARTIKERFDEEYVNVKDFGAVGDGDIVDGVPVGTDNAPFFALAVTAAAANSKKIWVPGLPDVDDFYLVTDTTDIPAATGLAIEGPGAQWPTIRMDYLTSPDKPVFSLASSETSLDNLRLGFTHVPLRTDTSAAALRISGNAAWNNWGNLYFDRVQSGVYVDGALPGTVTHFNLRARQIKTRDFSGYGWNSDPDPSDSGFSAEAIYINNLNGPNGNSGIKHVDVTGASGTFSVGETVTGGTSGATGRVYRYDAGNAILAMDSGVLDFVSGETLTGGTSSATATCQTDTNNKTADITLTGVSGGPYTAAETVTGGTSGATGVVEAFDATDDILLLSAVVGTFETAEILTGGSSSATSTSSVVKQNRAGDCIMPLRLRQTSVASIGLLNIEWCKPSTYALVDLSGVARADFSALHTEGNQVISTVTTDGFFRVDGQTGLKVGSWHSANDYIPPSVAKFALARLSSGAAAFPQPSVVFDSVVLTGNKLQPTQLRSVSLINANVDAAAGAAAYGRDVRSEAITGFTSPETPFNYSGSGLLIKEWNDIPIVQTAAATAIADAADEVNTVRKFTRKMIWDTTNNKPYWADGAGTTDKWYDAAGASVTPS